MEDQEMEEGKKERRGGRQVTKVVWEGVQNTTGVMDVMLLGCLSLINKEVPFFFYIFSVSPFYYTHF